MIWLVFWLFWLFEDVGLTGWTVVRGLCRDAGKSLPQTHLWRVFSQRAGLWNTLQKSKPNRRSRRSATKTSWVVSSTFARYVILVHAMHHSPTPGRCSLKVRS